MCHIITSIVGAVLVTTVCIVSFAVLPGIVKDAVMDQMVLYEDSDAIDFFEDLPFPLNFTVRLFNITNPEEFVAGETPIVRETGPYVYKIYRERLIEELDGDTVRYRILDHFEFSYEESFPHSDQDLVTVVNVPYNAILQQAESQSPALVPILSTALNSIFGSLNSPVMTVRVADLAFNGIPICENPGLIGTLACSQIRNQAADSANIVEFEDGSLRFSLFGYKNNTPTPVVEARRGLEDPRTLADIITWGGATSLSTWNGDICNMFNGTDSGIFAPSVDTSQSLFAYNPDICRSVEIKYQYPSTFKGLNTELFATDETLVDNHEECFCLRQTQAPLSVTSTDGCLLPGAMELNSCVGAPLVFTSPHFLYADPAYTNNIVGVSPNPDIHRIFVEVEPLTGTVVRGGKRGQFNIFMRPISSIGATVALPNVLTPIFWIEEGMSLPDDYAEILKDGLYLPLTVVPIVVWTLVAISVVVFATGIVCVVVRKRKVTTA